MNQQLGAMVTLLVASVSGVAVWQSAPAPGPRAAPTVAARAPGPAARPSWTEPLARWLDREFSLEVQRGEGCLTVRLAWRTRPPAVADGRR